MSLRELPVEAVTRDAFAPYGALVGVDPCSPPRSSAFYADKVELWSPGPFLTDSDACLSVARVHPRAPRVIWMERHFKHTQAFLPLGGAPLVLVVGAPTAHSAPDPATVRAFLFDGSIGCLLHVGTWHEFPFALFRPVDVVVMLRNETSRNLELREHDEAVGGDLEKRNLEARLGFGFGFNLNTGMPAT